MRTWHTFPWRKSDGRAEKGRGGVGETVRKRSSRGERSENDPFFSLPWIDPP